MKLIIDVVLLVIIALCTWGGFKRGLIGGIASLMAIVIALYGGSLLSSAYSGEVIPPTLCNPPGSSVHEIFQARILEWAAISSSKGSS